MIALAAMFLADFIGQNAAAELASLAAIRSPTSLPEGLTALLFETNWLYWLAALLLAATALYVGRARGDRRATLVGAALVAIVALWALAATLVDTPRERLEGAHRAILLAAEKKDVQGIMARLSPEFESAAIHVVRGPGDRREAIRKALEEVLARHGIKSNKVLGLKMTLEGRRALTNIAVLTDVESVGNVRTGWRLEWEDGAEGWLLVEARVDGFGAEGI